MLPRILNRSVLLCYEDFSDEEELYLRFQTLQFPALSFKIPKRSIVETNLIVDPFLL